MANFDDLSNEELRLKLLEYGLANMPVTQTTRKVLIKKLKNHLENTNTKVRRETIHVTKYSSDEDTDVSENTKKVQKDVNRRATIGVSAAKLAKTLPAMPDLPAPKPAEKSSKNDPVQKRRSGRITPNPSKDENGPTLTGPGEPMIIENSDEEEIAPSQNRRNRKSKSPSLARSDMVTTSYIRQTDGPPKVAIVEEMEIDLTGSTDAIEVPVPKPKVLTPSREPRFSSNITTTTTTSTNKRTTIGTSNATPVVLTTNRQTDFSTTFDRPSLSTTSAYTYSSPQPAAKREEIRIEPTDSPYLSEFTKRLQRLKAESAQLNAVKDHPIRRTIASGYAASPSRYEGDFVQSRLASARTGIRSETAKKDDIRASLRQVILALDQHYSFRKMLYVLIIMLIVIFLFVFFFL